MKLAISSFVAFVIVGLFFAANADVVLEDFGNPKHEWVAKSDNMLPFGSSSVHFVQSGAISFFDGFVHFQPLFSGPGYAKIIATDSFPSIAKCSAIEVTLQSATVFQGYYITFGNKPPYDNTMLTSGWRAYIPVTDYSTRGITIALTDFSNDWDFETGKIITPCSAKSSVCPPPDMLSHVKFLEIWAQGVEGSFFTNLVSIKGVGGC